MRSFIFLGIAFVAFIFIIVAHKLIEDNPFERFAAQSSASAGGGYLDTDSLATCLADRGALLFGAEWCPACRHQEELFGISAQYLAHVDCDEQPSTLR